MGKYRYWDKLILELGDELLNAEWKNVYIDNESTNYQISNTGLIRNTKKKILLTPGLDTDGYPQVGIYINSVRYNRKVHRLVAEAFIPNPDNKPQINHINGIKTDNRVENLEWATAQENVNHAHKNGLTHPLYGQKHPSTKFSDDQIHQVCRLLEENKLSHLEISKITGVPKGQISSIKRRRRWYHISKNYNIIYDVVGENHHNSIYTNDQVHTVCKLLEEDIKRTYKEITDKTGVNKSGIASIKFKTTWRHISDLYKI